MDHRPGLLQSNKQQTSTEPINTKMLRTVLNFPWRQHPTKKELYGHLQPVSNKIKDRRLRFSGHCWRSKNELASDLLLWKRNMLEILLDARVAPISINFVTTRNVISPTYQPQ